VASADGAHGHGHQMTNHRPAVVGLYRERMRVVRNERRDGYKVLQGPNTPKTTIQAK
jgi:hypothetical protein